MGAPASTAAINTYTLFFFQFAFTATATTIATGSMAGRTDFIGNLIYSAIMEAIAYPIVVHWVWNLGQAELTLNKKAGLFLGGGFDLLGIQILGVVAIAVFTVGFSFLMFGGLKALEHLRVNPEADRIGFDAYEHGALVWPDVYAIEQFVAEEDKNRTNTPEVSALDSE